MPRLLLPVPGLIQGVSQQTPALRLPSQLEACENAFPSESRGLCKRNPIEHVAALFEGTIGNSLVHFVDREVSAGERYAMIVNAHRGSFGSVRVFSPDGTEHPVLGPSATTPDFSYLNLDTTSNIFVEGAESFGLDVTDKWTELGATGSSNAPIAAVLAGPFGFPTTGVEQIGTAPGATSSTCGKTYVGLAMVDDGHTFSVYVHACVAADLAATRFELDLHDDAGSESHSASFGFLGGDVALFGQTNGAVGRVERLPAGWFRCSVSFAPGWGGTSATGDDLSARITVPEGNLALQRLIAVWGAMLHEGTEPLPYIGDPSLQFKALTVADYTLVLNTTKTVALDSPTTPASDFPSKAFLFVRQGAYNTTYEAILKRTGQSPQVASLTTWDGTTAANVREQWTIRVTNAGTDGANWVVAIQGQNATYTKAAGASVNVVATGIKNAIDALPNVSATVSTDTVTITGDFKGMDYTPSVTGVASTGTYTLTNTVPQSNTELAEIDTAQIATDLASQINALTGFDAEAHGSVVMITATGDDLESVTTKDGLGDTAMYAIWKQVEAVDQLPKHFLDGRKVRVAGATADTGDDLYVEFDTPVSGGWGDGVWTECAGFAVTTSLDADTMPHQLVRKFDDGAGTLTGTPNLAYFEFGPATWVSRAAGDDESNPAPGIVGERLASMFFHRNRLGFVGGAQVLLSEAARYFNLWRTSVTQLLESDPIDVTVSVGQQVVNLSHALPFDQRLLLFAEEAVYVLDGQPLLTPGSAQVDFGLALRASSKCAPVAADAAAYYPEDRGSFTQVHMLALSQSVDARLVPSAITAHVPKYIPPGARAIVPCLAQKCLAVLTSEENAIHLFKYFDTGEQRVQSAWVRLQTVEFARIRGAVAWGDELWFVTQHNADVAIERMSLDPGAVDGDLGRKVHLDRRVLAGYGTANPGVYALEFDETIIPMPFTFDDPQAVQAVLADGTPVPVLAVYESDTCPASVGVRGDWERVAIYVGEPYEMRVALTEPVPKGDNGPVLAARTTVRRVRLLHRDTSDFSVVIADGHGRGVTALVSPAVLSEHSWGSSGYETGTADVSVHLPARHLRVEVVSASTFPVSLGGAEWELEVVGKSGALS